MVLNAREVRREVCGGSRRTLDSGLIVYIYTDQSRTGLRRSRSYGKTGAIWQSGNLSIYLSISECWLASEDERADGRLPI